MIIRHLHCLHIKDADRFDIGGDGKDDRVIEKIVTVTEGDLVVSKREIEYRENGTEKFSSFESYRPDGSVDRRVEVAYAEDERRHEIETFYDEKGNISYQKVTDLDSSGYPFSVLETVPFESNNDPVESSDNVDHASRDYENADEHQHTEIVHENPVYDPNGDGPDGFDIHSTESWTDENGREHTVEINGEDFRDGASYKETIVDPASGETTILEGYYWTDAGGPETLVIEKQTVEQRKDDGTFESKTVTLYDGQSKDPVIEIKTTYGDDGVHVEKEERVDGFEKEDGTVETITRETTYDEDGHFDQITVNDTETTSLNSNDVEIAENENINDYYNDTDTEDRNEIDTETDDKTDTYVDIDEDDGDDWGDWRD